MICPNCEAEYVEGITTCADCGTTLIPNDQFVKKPDEVISLEDWVVVHSTQDIIEAEMLKSNLSGAGINAFIFSKEDRMRLNLSYVGSAPIKLFVRVENYDDAMQIINQINNEEIKDDEADGKTDE
ncbi:MAG: DUF2007 domain-containing protein [Stygiobacter sp.]|nr:MAG: DUF2007 domain-containing protein [Stygiobacter sp.]